MDLELLRFGFDIGLLILIWLVQLVIYPSFPYMDTEAIQKWHLRYTFRISWVVIPLMGGQLLIAIWQLWHTADIERLCNLLLVLLMWGLTFRIFVPLHRKIAEGKVTDSVLNALVAKNWTRTVGWTILAIWSALSLS